MKELNGNGCEPSIAQAIEEMKLEQGDRFSLDQINLAELERRTGISRGRLRRLKQNGFRNVSRSTKGRKHTVTKLSGYTGLLDSLLRQGVKNSSVIWERLQQAGFEGGRTIVKEYIAAHKHLIPAKRQLATPQETVAVDTPQSPVKPTRWTGALQMYWTTMDRLTASPALP